MPLAAPVFSWKSSSDASVGTRIGEPSRASGASFSLLPARWKDIAAGTLRSALPSHPSVRFLAVLAACQMSIERKCDWLGLG